MICPSPMVDKYVFVLPKLYLSTSSSLKLSIIFLFFLIISPEGVLWRSTQSFIWSDNNLHLFPWPWLCQQQKKRVFIFWVRFLLYPFPLFSIRTALWLSWYIMLLLNFYPCASRKYRVHKICGIRSSNSTRSALIDIYLFIYFLLSGGCIFRSFSKGRHSPITARHVTANNKISIYKPIHHAGLVGLKIRGGSTSIHRYHIVCVNFL